MDRGRVARFPDSHRPGSDRRRRGRRSRRRRSPVGAADLAPAAVPERQRVLLAITEALYAGAAELSLLTAADTRNALRTQARPESQTLANLFRYFGGIAGELKGTVLPAGDGQLQYSVREPVGVVGAILPWNSPLMIAGMKIPAALAAGNTMVVEPAEDAPLTVLELTEICSRFLSPGVLDVVTGRRSVVGEALVVHPGVDKVSFTGSTGVGRGVGAKAGERVVPVSLDLGGKSPTIVWPDAADDAHIDATVDGILLGMRFTRQGQSCTARSRLLVQHLVAASAVSSPWRGMLESFSSIEQINVELSPGS